MSKKLCELEWFTDIYVKIYNVLSVENALPHPCEISVLRPEDVEVSGSDTVLGLAWSSSRTIWFREWPPDPVTFAHELLHLVSVGKEVKFEEVYAYNLSHLAVLLAERDIIPPINVTKLFSASLSDVLEALRRVYHIEFKDVAEFFETIGVIPMFMKPLVSNDELRWVIDRRYSERLIVMDTVSELVGGAEYDEFMLNVLIELLKILAEKRRGGNRAQEG